MSIKYVTYRNDLSCDIILPKNSIYDDLKLRIYDEFRIRPKSQKIFGLPPNLDDEDELNFTEDQRIILVVEKSEVKDDYGELFCVFSFKRKCPQFPCRMTRLKYLLTAESKKLILLYLNNDKSDCFMDDALGQRTIQWENLDTLCWDIQDDSYHDALKKTLRDNLEDCEDLIRDVFKSKSSSLFILLPSCDVSFFTCIESTNFNLKHIRLQINKAQRILNENVAEKLRERAFLKIEANQFQQDMMFKLGNRDYDVFQPNEHNCLKYKIAFAYFGAPQKISDEEKPENFDFQPNIQLYDEKQRKIVENAYKQITKQSNLYAKHNDKVVMRVIYNVAESLPEKDKATVNSIYPIFVVRKCKKSEKSCNIYIDHQCRVYETFQAYVEEVKLHQCVMVLPENGMYQIRNDLVALVRIFSPSCNLGSKILQGLDIATSAFGMLTATVASVAGGVAAGIGAGVYGIGRGISDLRDKTKHDEDMSFSNQDARTTYLNIVAGAFNLLAGGAVNGITTFAAEGIQVSQFAEHVVNGIIASLATKNIFSYKANWKIVVTTGFVKEKLTEITFEFIRKLDSDIFNIRKQLFDFDPKTNWFIQIIKVIMNFFKDQLNKYYADYEERKKEAEKSPDFDKEKFDSEYVINPEIAITFDKGTKFLEMAIMVFSIKSDDGLKNLISYFYDWLAAKSYEMTEKNARKVLRKRSTFSQIKEKRICTVCSGHHYAFV